MNLNQCALLFIVLIKFIVLVTALRVFVVRDIVIAIVIEAAGWVFAAGRCVGDWLRLGTRKQVVLRPQIKLLN